MRPRVGIGFVQAGVVYCGVRTRAGKRRVWPVLDTDPPPAGVALGPAWAKAVSLARQAAYDAGAWSPPERGGLVTAQAPPPPVAAPPALGPETFYGHVRGFLAAQTYESAPKELAAFDLYVRGWEHAGVPLAVLRPLHAVAFATHLKSRPSRRGGTVGHSVVASVFNACARALDAAQVAELIQANPLRLAAVVAMLPPKRDKVPGARATWRFSPAQVVALCTDPRLAEHRRVENALDFCTGERPGEGGALRWRDWDRATAPLTALSIARAITSVSNVEGHTKTTANKLVPVHPFLAGVLAAWWREGWARHMGRAPTPDDLIIPSVRGRKKGQPGNRSSRGRAFRADCRKLGIDPKHAYAKRHTLVRLLADAGAVRHVVRWATHAPPSSVYDGYADAPAWPVLCAEFLKLPLPAEPEGSVMGSVTTPVATAENDNDLAEAQRNRSFSRGGEGSQPHANRSTPEGSNDPNDTERGGFVTGSVTDVTPLEGLLATQGALFAWHDRALLAELDGVH